MDSIFGIIARRSGSPTFRRSFALILLAEAITILVAWLLLDANISGWIHDKTTQAIRISQLAASSRDWSLANSIPRDKKSPVLDRYRDSLKQLSKQQFPTNEGGVYLAVVDGGETYVLDPDDSNPMDDVGKANQWEREAYSSGKISHNDVPYSDGTGTYLEALTPILSNGKVVGLVGAEYDSATLAEFQALVRKAFWLSILPAILLSLIVAYLFANMFVEPMEIFRRIEETASRRGSVTSEATGADPLDNLSPREREVAELVRQGLKNKEIAEKLFVTQETIKQHLKNIKDKTGFSKLDLAVQAEASRIQAAPPATP
jgi:DNA-binding NarL/FixJ family response regulator